MSLMFEVFTKEVEIEGQVYKIRPLNGRFLGKLFAVFKDLKLDEKTDEKSSFDNLGEGTIEKLHEIILETFSKSYPENNKDELEEWVSQNLFKLIEPVIQVNIPTEDESKGTE